MDDKEKYPLKSCPFCGSHAVNFYWEEDEDYVDDHTYVVECSECFAHGGSFTSHEVKISKIGAAKTWNERAYKE